MLHACLYCHTVDKEENFCLKPFLTCQHNSSMQGGKGGISAEVQASFSTSGEAICKAECLKCFCTETSALKIEHTCSSM